MSSLPASLPLSLVVIAKDEEANIERCLISVPFAAERIVVVDAASSDATVEIAKRLGARVVIESWRGFKEQKALAASLSSSQWILSLDADEALSDAASTETVRWLKSKEAEHASGMEYPRISWNLGRWIRHGGWYPDVQLRLYHRDRCEWRAGHLHERVYVRDGQAPAGRFQSPILHWPFATLAEQVDTNNRYSTLGARDLRERGRSFSVFALIFKPISKFVETYFIKRGLMDGMAGFIISVGAAYSMFLKHAKLREIERLSEPRSAKQTN